MSRSGFLTIAVAMIVAGLLLRLPHWGLPLALHHYGGGVLWSAMVCAFVAAVRPSGWGHVTIVGIAIVVVAGVELSRLVHTATLDVFRTTLPGQLLLGHIYSSWNILADTLGILAVAIGIRPSVTTSTVALGSCCRSPHLKDRSMDQLSSNTPPGTVPARTMSPALKFALEMGPLLLFFFANFRPKLFEPLMRPVLPAKLLEGKEAGLFTATGILMVAVILALIVSFLKTRRLPVMPLVTAILVVIFGALTLYFQDPRFIKMKPTILYALFGGGLLGGLAFGRPLLPVMLDNAMSLTEEGWTKLTLRWGIFFLALAVANEFVWRSFSEHTWVLFKFPGTMILIFVFTFSQVPLIMRYELKGEAAEKAPEHI